MQQQPIDRHWQARAEQFMALSPITRVIGFAGIMAWWLVLVIAVCVAAFVWLFTSIVYDCLKLFGLIAYAALVFIGFLTYEKEMFK